MLKTLSFWRFLIRKIYRKNIKSLECSTWNNSRNVIFDLKSNLLIVFKIKNVPRGTFEVNLTKLFKNLPKKLNF